MPDELTPGAAGQGGQETPAGGDKGFDFERSYNELRPEYTRTTQELAAERERLSEYEQLFAALHDSDPETQRAAMDALGLEVDTGSQGQGAADDEFVDPLEQEVGELRSTVAELRAAREQEASEAEQANLDALRDDFIGEAITFIEGETSMKFTDREEEALGNLAISMADDDGVPDVQGAYNLMYGDEGVLEINRQRWIETKTGAAQAPLGRSVPAEQKPQTAADRINYIDERWRALADQE